MNGTENNSETKQGKPGSGGAITADRGGFNELEKVAEIGCVLKEMSGGGRSIPKIKPNQFFLLLFLLCFHLSICCVSFPEQGRGRSLGESGSGQSC